MTGTVGDLIRLGLSKVGFRYFPGPTRDTGEDGYYDCSGFATFLERHAGNAAFPSFFGSHDQALYCRDHGLLVPGALGSQEQIGNAPIGSMLFEGPMHAYVGGYNIPGHVVIKIGDNKTVEAMGRAWGVCVGRIHGRNWSNAGLFPGIDYDIPDTGDADPDSIEGPQLGDDMSAVIPSHATYFKNGPLQGRKPFFNLDFQGGNVLAHNGVKLTWRGAPTKSVPFGDVLVYDIPINGPFLDMSEGEVVRVMPNGDHLVQKDGTLIVLAADGGVATADIDLP